MSKIHISGRYLFLNRHIINIPIIATIGFIIYSNTFNVPFHFDDYSNIVNNFYLRDLSWFWTPKSLRWVGYFSFALNFQIGGLNVTGYHIINLIIHILNSILVYYLVILTFKTSVFQSLISKNGIREYPNYLIALMSGLLFIAHPVQTQSVTFIVQRFASLATMFYLFSLIMYVKVRLFRTANDHDKVEGEKYIPYIFLYLLSLVSAILAMMTKEISFTLPFIIICYEIFLIRKPSQYRLPVFDKKMLYPVIPFILTLLIIPLTILKVNRPVEDILGEISGTVSQGVYLLTQLRVIVTYIRLLFLPINQNLDYDYPLSYSLFEVKTLLSFLFILFIIGIVIYIFKLSRRTNNGYLLLISLGIFWFFITLSIESSVIPIKDVIYEHRLYLPSVGAVISFSTTLIYILNYLKNKKVINESYLPVFIILLLITTVPLGIATYKRNLVWKDELTLWEDIVKKSPKKARVYNNLGNVYGSRGLIDKAIEHYHIALRIKPDYAEVYNNLGEAYKSKGIYDEAIENYLIALNLRPDFPEACNNLGVAYSSKGQIDKAIELFQKSIKLKYEYAEAHNNLGVAYKSMALNDKAIEHYRIALKIMPDFIKARLNLGLIYLKNGDKENARKEFEAALKISPDDLFARHFLDSISDPSKTTPH